VDNDHPFLVPRDLVAQNLSISTATLRKLETRGLVRVEQHEGIEGYRPLEIRRLWTILTFHRDLGINLAGIEVILRLRDEMKTARSSMERLAQELRDTLEDADGSDRDG